MHTLLKAATGIAVVVGATYGIMTEQITLELYVGMLNFSLLLSLTMKGEKI